MRQPRETKAMIYVKLRSGEFGCGIVGDNLCKALGALTTVERLDVASVQAVPLRAPLLERMDNRYRPSAAATRNVAYAVFEQDVTVQREARQMSGRFDALAPASRWCEHILRDAGLKELTTIHQAVDGSLFNPGRAVRTRAPDRFVIFSGGKLELRKGQDIVARAFGIFSQRHSDAVLLASWENSERSIAGSMMGSPYSPFRVASDEPFDDAIRRWLVDAGVDLRRVELVGHTPHAQLASVYGNTDVGLFPNRCEGGTNLVMMEYMACGRPVIATDFSGHRDVLTECNSFRLQSLELRPLMFDQKLIACWCEPDVEEILARLEDAYSRREYAASVGAQAAESMAAWTWDRAARQFMRLLDVSSSS
jgi:glycosyltransferase involved in cell wall biosynthesis